MDWASKLAKIMADKHNTSPLMFAKVISRSPLNLEISGEVIEQFIFRTSSTNSFEVGDEVIVLRRENEFYIISKVIR